LLTLPGSKIDLDPTLRRPAELALYG